MKVKMWQVDKKQTKTHPKNPTVSLLLFIIHERPIYIIEANEASKLTTLSLPQESDLSLDIA